MEKDIDVRIHNRRIELGLTIRELAKKVGVSHASVSRWETGVTDQLRLEHIGKLADALYVSPLYLLGLTEEKPNVIIERLCNRIRKMNDNDLQKLEQMIDLMFKK